MENNKIITFKIYPNLDFGFKTNKFILSTLIRLFCGCNNIDNVTYEKCYNKNLKTIKYTKYYFKLKKKNIMLNCFPFCKHDMRNIPL